MYKLLYEFFLPWYTNTTRILLLYYMRIHRMYVLQVHTLLCNTYIRSIRKRMKIRKQGRFLENLFLNHKIYFSSIYFRVFEISRISLDVDNNDELELDERKKIVKQALALDTARAIDVRSDVFLSFRVNGREHASISQEKRFRDQNRTPQVIVNKIFL